MDTLSVIRDILQENLDIDPETVTEESTFESLKLDSLNVIELICELEDRLEIDLGEPEGIENVGQFIDYIKSL